MSNKPVRQRGRRAHDEGSLRQRPDGRWEGRFYLPNGERSSVYGKTQKEASAKLKSAMAKVSKGLSLKADWQPLAAYLTVWLEEVARPKLAYSTLKSYESYLNRHIIPELGHIKLGELTPQDVQKFLNKRARSGLTPRTVQYLRAILRSALAEAEAWGYIERNSASLAKAPKMERREVSVLTATDARALIASTVDDRIGNLFALALYTGLRQGELLGLRWPDIDLDQGTIQIRKALQKQGREMKFIEPKTARSRRKIFLPAAAVSILTHQKVNVDVMRRHAGSAWQDWDLVFPSQVGTPLDGSNVTHHLQRKLTEAGLPRVRFHDLRHTCATLLLEQGVQDRVIMEQLGHSQITLTLNTYSHVRPTMLSAAAAALDHALGTQSSMASETN